MAAAWILGNDMAVRKDNTLRCSANVMRHIGDTTYKEMKDMTLVGCEEDVPEDMKEALEDTWKRGLNARRKVATIKGAFGNGEKPRCPQ